MLFALTAGGFIGYLFLFAMTGLVVGVPIVGTLRKNKRDSELVAEAKRSAHMDGWVPGSTLAFGARCFEGRDSGSEAPGPRIVATAPNPALGSVTIVNGKPPTRPDFSRFYSEGDPLAVLREDATPGNGVHEVASMGTSRLDAAARDTAEVEPGAALVPLRLGFRPPARPALREGMVEAMVLGVPQLGGCLVQPGRAKVIELGCYLALHGSRKMKRSEVVEAVFVGEDPGKATGTLRNLMWMLRQCWGDELVPSATHGLYSLSEKVTTDWQRFSDLVDEAVGESEIDTLTRALTLFRGMPVEGAPDGSYGWAETEMLVSDMENAGRRAAHRLARSTLAAGDLDHARWAAEKGLVVSPYDSELWRVLLEVAGKRSKGELERVYERARGVLGDEATALKQTAPAG